MTCIVLLILILSHQVINQSLDNDRRKLLYSRYEQLNEYTIQRTDYYQIDQDDEDVYELDRYDFDELDK